MKPQLALVALLLATSAHASSSLRCGSALISLEDHVSEVLSKCGEPVSRDFIGYREVIDDYGFSHEVQVEEWTYGPRNGMYHFLRFQGNRLMRIDAKRGN